MLQLTKSLEDALVDAPLPLSGKPLENAHLLLELCKQIVKNHTQLVLHPGFHRYDLSQQAEWLTRTLEWLAQTALYQAQVYDPPGEDFWQTFYQIYQLAEQRNLLSSTNPTNHDVGTQAFRILLFSLAGPQRFRQREQQQIDRLLQRFARHTVVRHQATYHNQQAGFFFDCASPHPPQSIKLLKQSGTPGTLRFLFLQKVVRHLLDYVSSPEPQGTEILPLRQAKKLALHLAHAYGVPRQRQWPRLQKNDDCHVVIGLEDIIIALEQQGRSSAELRALLPTSPQNFNALLGIDSKLSLLDEPDRSSYEGLTDERSSEVDGFRQLLESRDHTHDHDIWDRRAPRCGHDAPQFICQIADASAQGYRLLWLDHTTARLKVGELVGIVHSPTGIEIATIRWLRKHQDHTVTLGVELLGSNAQAVVTSTYVLPNSQTEPQYTWGLLLLSQRPGCLIVPASTWQRGQWVDIHQDRDTKESYCLQKLLDATPGL